MGIKENYLQIKNLLDNVPQDSVKFISNLRLSYYKDKRIKDMQNILWFYNDQSKSKIIDYILGDKILSLQDISSYMINKLQDYLKNNIGSYDEGEYLDSYGCYDEDGYYTPDSIKNLISFYTNLTDDKLYSIYSGENDDMDFDGGRCYFLNGFDGYLFSYFRHTKNMSLKSLDAMICNSSSTNESVSYFYEYDENISIPTVAEFEQIYQNAVSESYKDITTRYNSIISGVIKNFKEPILSDLVAKLPDLMATDEYILAKIRDNKINNII